MKSKLINADCMSHLPGFADNHFDLAIVDPPYGNNYSMAFDTRMCKPLPNRKAPIERGFYKKKTWDESIPDKEYFGELLRVSKNQIIWGGNYFIQYLYNTKGIIVWDKEKKIPTYADGEMAWSSFDKPLKIFYYLWDGFKQAQQPGKNAKVQGNHKIKEKRIHPTQKPVALYRWLLINYGTKGDRILDTHVGSGSSLVACIMEGFDYVGYEIDKEYYDGAMKRIKAEQQKIDMFK